MPMANVLRRDGNEKSFTSSSCIRDCLIKRSINFIHICVLLHSFFSLIFFLLCLQLNFTHMHLAKLQHAHRFIQVNILFIYLFVNKLLYANYLIVVVLFFFRLFVQWLRSFISTFICSCVYIIQVDVLLLLFFLRFLIVQLHSVIGKRILIQ